MRDIGFLCLSPIYVPARAFNSEKDRSFTQTGSVMSKVTPLDMLSMSCQQISELTIAQILSALIQIPGVNPIWQSPKSGLANEKARAEFLAGLFRKLEPKVEVHIDYIKPDRPNVFVKIQVDFGDWTVWDTHIDTVTVDNMTIAPFSGDIRDGKVWGRGASDTLASAAIAIKLMFMALPRGAMPYKNLLLCFTMGEENGGEGAKMLAPWFKAQKIVVDEFITSEPTMLQAVFSHNGIIRGELQLKGYNNRPIDSAASMLFLFSGRSGHTSDPDNSYSALYAAAKFMLRIEAVDGLHVTSIRCGGLSNTIPDYCTIIIEQEARVHVSRASMLTEITSLAPSMIECLDPDTEMIEVSNMCSDLPYSAARVVIAIQEEHERLKREGMVAVTGRPVISATGLIKKGPTYRLFIDRRVVPGEDEVIVFDELLLMLRKKIALNEALVETTVPVRKQRGFQTDSQSALITNLASLSGNIPTTAKYGTNLLYIEPSIFRDSKVVAVVFGPGDIAQAHTAAEYIEIPQLEAAFTIMAKFFSITL